MDRAAKSLKKSKGNFEDAQQALKKIQAQERKALRDGQRALNKNKR